MLTSVALGAPMEGGPGGHVQTERGAPGLGQGEGSHSDKQAL